MNDEPLLHPGRLYYALMWWLFWNRKARLSLRWLLRFHRRPHAALDWVVREIKEIQK